MATLWSRRKQVAAPTLSPMVDPIGETPISIHLVSYNPQECVERTDIEASECQGFLEKDTFTWIHVQGQPKPSELRDLGEPLNLHALALEDIINAGERSKTEIYDDQILMLLGMPIKRGFKIINEQVSFFLGRNYLISFHNGVHDPFKAVRRRLRHPQAALRTRRVDYLLYVLVDVVIDQGFPILDEFEDEIEAVEHELISSEGLDTFRSLYTIKRELLVLTLKLRPQREAVQTLMRDDKGLLQPETKIYLRDCYDHTIRLVDMLEIYRDITSNMLDVYLSLVNKKTFHSNEVQRKATVWATLFAPLTFITGVYGMNFIFMPELNWHYGFFAAMGFMGISGFALWSFFKRRKWL